LILHLNTKYCHASPDKANRILVVSIGKKCCQELDDAYSVEFAYRVAATTPEYFDVGLNAKTRWASPARASSPVASPTILAACVAWWSATSCVIASLSTPISARWLDRPVEQFEKRLRSWFAATELYPRQLHEVDRAPYLAMKRSEYQRMQKSP
jgi:hypothetical protein